MQKVVLVLFIIFGNGDPPQSQRHAQPNLMDCMSAAVQAFADPPKIPHVSTYGAACIVETVQGRDA